MAVKIMIQGTSSFAGKSTVCTALCRLLRDEGLRVAPFKAWNMSLNSYITAGGGEIGRAQGAQAEAAGVEATVEMNPILVKPEAEATAQVIVRGRPYASLAAGDYGEEAYYRYARQVIGESLALLDRRYDAIVIEGAGSPAEINYKGRDLANMSVAALAGAPVLLVADIDRGGAFASLVGTLELLEPDERARVAGMVINKFRGDRRLLQPGLDLLVKRTGKPVLGVLPFIAGLGGDEEDEVFFETPPTETEPAGAQLDIAVIRLPQIANFTDLAPLARESGVLVRYVSHPASLGHPAAIIIPGTQNTVADCAYLHRSGLAPAIKELARQNVPLLGIGGGYQMLGRQIRDPQGALSRTPSLAGLGLLDMETEFYAARTARRVQAQLVDAARLPGCGGAPVEGYALHMGVSFPGSQAQALFHIPADGGVEDEGLVDGRGLVFGTYLHGLFDNDRWRAAWLNLVRRRWGIPEQPASYAYSQWRQSGFQALARMLRLNMDLCGLYRAIGL